MIVVGIDPSLSNTAVVIGESCDDFDVRCFSSKPLGDSVKHRIDRFVDLAQRIASVVDDGVRAAHSVFVEGYSMASKGRSITAICEFGGILRRELVWVSDVREVTPTTLKKFATGSGSASKDIVAARLTKTYGVELANTDEYDAFALYQLGLMCCGVTKPTNETQRQCINAVMESTQKPRRKVKA